MNPFLVLEQRIGGPSGSNRGQPAAAVDEAGKKWDGSTPSREEVGRQQQRAEMRQCAGECGADVQHQQGVRAPAAKQRHGRNTPPTTVVGPLAAAAGAPSFSCLKRQGQQ